MNLNKQQSEKYLEIVRRGNMDDMFDYGRECERQAVIKEIEGLLAEKEVEYEDNLVSQEISFFIAELRAKLAEMKGV